MTERIFQIATAAIVIVLLLVGYLAAVESMLGRLREQTQAKLRPWLWLAPALILASVFLVYPMINTIFLSLMNARSTEFVGLQNYIYAFTSSDMLTAIRNNLLWLVFFTLLSVTLGLLIAVLTDRVPYERVAKAVIFLPMAISFVAAGVIWKFMFDYRPPGSPQTGTLNALWTSLGPGMQPVPWLINPATNNPALIIVSVWMSAGFCMVILSAGLKGIPTELIEAARVDGANEWQIFWRLTFPLLAPTIAVVATTMIITTLKAFDIVYVLTNGNYGTDLIATQMYKELFSSKHFGRAAAIAVLLLIATIPVMIANVRTFRRQEETR